MTKDSNEATIGAGLPGGMLDLPRVNVIDPVEMVQGGVMQYIARMKDIRDRIIASYEPGGEPLYPEYAVAASKLAAHVVRSSRANAGILLSLLLSDVAAMRAASSLAQVAVESAIASGLADDVPPLEQLEEMEQEMLSAVLRVTQELEIIRWLKPGDIYERWDHDISAKRSDDPVFAPVPQVMASTLESWFHGQRSDHGTLTEMFSLCTMMHNCDELVSTLEAIRRSSHAQVASGRRTKPIMLAQVNKAGEPFNIEFVDTGEMEDGYEIWAMRIDQNDEFRSALATRIARGEEDPSVAVVTREVDTIVAKN